MSTEYYVYRYYCQTTATTLEWVLPASSPIPTTCYEDPAHTIDTASVTVIKVIKDNIFKIQEEDIPTGGYYGAFTVSLDGLPNTTTSTSISFPFPINVLSLKLIMSSEHTGDTLDLTVGENTIIGAISNVLPSVTAWTSQNYTTGSVVTYTHPTFGSRIYTCILNTVSNENPTDKTYWTHGYQIPVTSTVLDNTFIGANLQLYDVTNTDNLDRIISIDNVNSYVYVETAPVNSFSPATPTYVRQTVYYFKNFELYGPGDVILGENKIGGTYIPADTLITGYYHNASVDTTKHIVGFIEYLR